MSILEKLFALLQSIFIAQEPQPVPAEITPPATHLIDVSFGRPVSVDLPDSEEEIEDLGYYLEDQFRRIK